MKVQNMGLRFVLAGIICFALLSSTAFAAEIEPQAANQSNSYISASGRSVTSTGISRSFVVEDKISVTVYLQELHGATWVTISTGSKSLNNASSVQMAKITTVSGGYLYRVMSYHEFITGGDSQGFYTYSTEKTIP